MVESKGPSTILVWDFGGSKVYSGVLTFRVFTGLFHSENTGRLQVSDFGQKTISYDDFSGARRVFNQVDTGPSANLDGNIYGATVNFSTGHRSFPGLVFP